MACVVLLLALTSLKNLELAPPVQPFITASINNADPAQESVSVGDLIRVLDKVRPVAYASPDTWLYEGDPIYRALYEKGPDAVEPLIKAFASDDRPIDNTVEGIKQDRFKPVKAKDIAYRILLDILDCGDVYDLNHVPTPKELGAFWKANRNIAPAERHYNVLKNDAASVDNWAKAAQRLTDPVGSKRRIESFTGGSARSGMLGEPLRNYANPSITELLEKRLRMSVNPAGAIPTMGDPETLVRSVAKWDPSGSLETLRTLCRVRMHPGELGDHLTLLLIDARIKLGDATAVPEYLTWIMPALTMSNINYYAMNYIFQPFGYHSDDPGIRKAVAETVKTEGSIWSPKGLSESAGWFIASPLIVFPEFYDSVLAALDDKAVSDSKDAAVAGKRVCDLVAAHMVFLREAPAFDPKSSEADRDQAIAKMKDFLKANRTHPRDLIDWPSNWQDVL